MFESSTDHELTDFRYKQTPIPQGSNEHSETSHHRKTKRRRLSEHRATDYTSSWPIPQSQGLLRITTVQQIHISTSPRIIQLTHSGVKIIATIKPYNFNRVPKFLYRRYAAAYGGRGLEKSWQRNSQTIKEIFEVYPLVGWQEYLYAGPFFKPLFNIQRFT